MKYQYKCFNCGHQFEIKQSIKDDKLKECPECKQEKLERIISAPSVIYKGNNWTSKGGEY